MSLTLIVFLIIHNVAVDCMNSDVPYDALKPKWEELDRFGKYDVLREVELQALKSKIDFSNNPTENLQITPASKIDFWTLFSRKMGTVIVSGLIYPSRSAGLMIVVKRRRLTQIYTIRLALPQAPKRSRRMFLH